MCSFVVLAAPTAKRMQKTPLITVCVSQISGRADIREWKILLREFRAVSVACLDDGAIRKTVRAKEGSVTRLNVDDPRTRATK